MATPLLEATHLSYSTPTGRVLAQGIDFALHPGGLLLVTGPNGSGKSMLLRVLLGLNRPHQGLVRCAVRRGHIAHIPQLQNIDFHLPLTLGDVLEIGVGKLTRTAITDVGLLEERQLGIAWNTASGGERQRTMLTRALLREPQLLLLDEPLNHLDRKSQALLLNALVRFLSHPLERAVVLVSHEDVFTLLAKNFRVTSIDLWDKRPKETA